MKDKQPSKKRNLKHLLETIIVISIIVVFSLSLGFAFFFFSTLGIFHLLSIQFDSFLSIISFIIFYFLIGIVFDIFVGALILLLNDFGSYTLQLKQIALFVITFLANWAVISFLDYVMHSLHIGLIATIVIALIFTLVEFALESFEKDRKNG